MTYWHFTAMQVRRKATRGLDLHLARLDAANREIFDTPLDGDEVRARIRQALGDTDDASVRVIAAEAGFSVTVRPPAPDPPSPQRVQSVAYQRPLAHLKHSGGFAQEYYRRRAERAGFDEILLTGPDGEIAEGGITNVAFVDGDALVWPDAPHLAGITMQLVEKAVPGRHSPVHVDALRTSEGGFLTNSHGIAVIASVDDIVLPIARAMQKRLHDAYTAVPWDVI
jgi:branched-subunit amino acid aminotransferase/4-amino-4-deoxychorismate lyase